MSGNYFPAGQAVEYINDSSRKSLRTTLVGFVKSLTNRYVYYWERPANGFGPREACAHVAAQKAMYTPQQIANYFLRRANQEGLAITPIKLLKLIYIAYGWYSAVEGRRLFNEPIQAWKHGPVIPSIYQEFKHYGRHPIDCLAVDFDLDTLELVEPEVDSDDADTLLVLDRVWSGYKKYSGWSLVDRTHLPGTPWSQSYIEGRRDIVIPDELIKQHFTERLDQYLSGAEALT